MAYFLLVVLLSVSIIYLKISPAASYFRSGFNHTDPINQNSSPLLVKFFRIIRNTKELSGRPSIWRGFGVAQNHMEIKENDIYCTTEWYQDNLKLQNRLKRGAYSRLRTRITKQGELKSLDSQDDIFKEQIASVSKMGGMEDSWKYINNLKSAQFQTNDNTWQNFEHVQNAGTIEQHLMRFPRDISQENPFSSTSSLVHQTEDFSPLLQSPEIVVMPVSQLMPNTKESNIVQKIDELNHNISSNVSETNDIQEVPMTSNSSYDDVQNIYIPESLEQINVSYNETNHTSSHESTSIDHTVANLWLENDSITNEKLENKLNASVLNFTAPDIENKSNSNNSVTNKITLKNKTNSDFIFENCVFQEQESNITKENNNLQFDDESLGNNTDETFWTNASSTIDDFAVDVYDVMKDFIRKAVYCTTKILKKIGQTSNKFFKSVGEQVKHIPLVNRTLTNAKSVASVDTDLVRNTTGKILNIHLETMKNVTSKVMDYNLNLYQSVMKKVSNQSNTSLPLGSTLDKIKIFYLGN